jgi:hypothetical protein
MALLYPTSNVSFAAGVILIRGEVTSKMPTSVLTNYEKSAGVEKVSVKLLAVDVVSVEG